MSGLVWSGEDVGCSQNYSQIYGQNYGKNYGKNYVQPNWPYSLLLEPDPTVVPRTTHYYLALQ